MASRRYAAQLGNFLLKQLENETIPIHPALPLDGLHAWRDVVYADGANPALPASSAQSAGSAEPGSTLAAVSTHPKHRLDVYIPSGGAFPRPLSPIVLFVHGGSWQGGDRQHTLADHLYSNVGIASARAGYVGMVMSYRTAKPVWSRLGESFSDVAWDALSPGATAGLSQSPHSQRPLQAAASAAASIAAAGSSAVLSTLPSSPGTSGGGVLSWGGVPSSLLSWLSPSAAQPQEPEHTNDEEEHPYAVSYEDQVRDVAAATAWAMRHGRRFGGDAQRVVLAGHSAGAHLAALVASQPKWLADAGIAASKSGARSPLGGLVLLSGVFNIPRLATTPLGPLICAQAFGKGEAGWRAASPTLSGTGPDSPLHGLPVLTVNAEEDGHLEQDAEELEARIALGGLQKQVEGGQNATRIAHEHRSSPWWGDLPDSVVIRPQLLPGSPVHRTVVQGRGHMTSVMGIGQPGDGTGVAVEQFLKAFVG